jgi:hypothetical protein
MWGALISSALLQTGVLGEPLPDRRFVPPAWTVEQTVIADQLRFNELWGHAWRASLLADVRAGNIAASRERGALLHCHAPDPRVRTTPARVTEDVNPLPAGMKDRLVPSAYHPHLLCPHFVTAAPVPPRDERVTIDTALAPAYRSLIASVRDSLLRQLDAAAARAPESRLISGLRLRLALDQRDAVRITRAVEECGADAWWCALLRGHERARAGDVWGARAAFARAEALPGDHCAVFDVSLLPSGGERVPRSQRPCMRSAALRDTLWWLSRPFMDDTVPRRRVEHYSRGVDALLQRLLPSNERFRLTDSAGGDAYHDVWLRHGPPAVTTVLGIGTVDQLHTSWLLDNGHLGPVVELYPTLEYRRGSISLVPTWAAIRAPFDAAPTDWQVSAPRDDYEQPDLGWFPQESWWPHVPMVQLQRGQLATLRRQDSVHVATAMPFMPNGMQRPPQARVSNIRMLISRSPTHVERVSTFAATIGRPLVARGDVPALPTVIGVEYDADASTGAPAGRTRWGLRPPPPLNVLAAGEIAISAPVLVASPGPRDDITPDPDVMLPRMLPSTTFAPRSQVGVYWETYGIVPGDTVELALWIQRVTPLSPMRQLGVTLRVATDLNTPVASQWTEPQSARSAFMFGRGVPIMGRFINLDLSSLIEGDYVLEVAVARPGQPPVRGGTRLVIGG